jgi:hypothetical protein
MLERYGHIRSQAKQAAIQALEQGAIEPILHAIGHKNGHISANDQSNEHPNLFLEMVGPPGFDQTRTQEIMEAKREGPEIPSPPA